MVSEQVRQVIENHWRLANARQWDEFSRLLGAGLQYEVPQTREYIDGELGYLEMFRTWPGNWQAEIRHLVCDQDKAVCIIDFQVGGECMTGISVFALKAGRIVQVIDYWPEPYEPPPRVSPWMKRRPGGPD